MNWQQAFVGNGSALLQTVVIGVCAYIGLVIVLRVFGKRTLSKWSAFDLVVTVALGSGLASALVSESVSLLQGITAFAVLASLQFVVSWLSVRWQWVRRLSRSEPRLLLLNGQLQHDAMREERVTATEIRASLRAQGIGDQSEIGAVILETDGKLSVVRELSDSVHSTLGDVRGIQG